MLVVDDVLSLSARYSDFVSDRHVGSCADLQRHPIQSVFAVLLQTDWEIGLPVREVLHSGHIFNVGNNAAGDGFVFVWPVDVSGSVGVLEHVGCAAADSIGVGVFDSTDGFAGADVFIADSGNSICQFWLVCVFHVRARSVVRDRVKHRAQEGDADAAGSRSF